MAASPFSSDIPYRLALRRAPGLGDRRCAQLLQCFGTAEAVFHANSRELLSAGIPDSTLDYLRAPDWHAVECDRAWLDAPARHLLCLDDLAYPKLLREIADPPFFLFVLGDPACLQAIQVAVVGSRNPSTSGRETAFDFAKCLAQCGVTITSGLAIGIDAASHYGALDAGARTIAVAATGLDKVYPARHKELAQTIAHQGALVSPFPPGVSPEAKNFPQRNRIISGLSVGTLVVQATRHSGSLITAHMAMEQGREVFAVPGSIQDPLARGCHLLIREGAKLVETVEDIIEELGPLVAACARSPESATQESELDEEQRRSFLDSICFDPVTVDGLVERTGLTASTVSSMLLTLELDGYVGSEAGGRYIRRR